jgi:hypothetical protein
MYRGELIVLEGSRPTREEQRVQPDEEASAERAAGALYGRDMVGSDEDATLFNSLQDKQSQLQGSGS